MFNHTTPYYLKKIRKINSFSTQPSRNNDQIIQYGHSCNKIHRPCCLKLIFTTKEAQFYVFQFLVFNSLSYLKLCMMLDLKLFFFVRQYTFYPEFSKLFPSKVKMEKNMIHISKYYIRTVDPDCDFQKVESGS